MQKKVLTIFVVVSLAACTNEMSFEKDIAKGEIDIQQQDPYRRSYAEAIEIAQNSIKMLQDGTNTTRSPKPIRTLNLKTGVKAVRQTTTRSDGSFFANDTLLYIFNFDNELGFAVISASRQTEGLIAVAEFGNYDPSEPTNNPGFDLYMQMAKSYVANTEMPPIPNKPAITPLTPKYASEQKIDTIFLQKIQSKIAVKWGQNGRIGQYCPNGLSGCANTAAAQIMSFFKYPTQLQLTYSGKDVSSTPLDWNAMVNHKQTDCDTNRDEADKQIGRLACQLEKLAGSIYYAHDNPKKNHTETSCNAIRKAIASLGYSVSSIKEYTSQNSDIDFRSLLAEGKLICMGGLNSDDSGHFWVIDGCFYMQTSLYYIYTVDDINWEIDYNKEIKTYTDCHNHINWGLNGAQNGYFNSAVFNMYNILQKDSDNLYDIVSGQNVDFYKKLRYFSVWH